MLTVQKPLSENCNIFRKPIFFSEHPVILIDNEGQVKKELFGENTTSDTTSASHIE